jgi:hypothetical protein
MRPVTKISAKAVPCDRRLYAKTVDRGALAYIRVMGCGRHFVYRLGYQTSHTDLLPEGLHTHMALPAVGERQLRIDQACVSNIFILPLESVYRGSSERSQILEG